MATAGDRRSSFGELFPQLFLFPLVIVVVCVLVYLFFVAAGRDNRSVEELIRDIQTGGPHARSQDAYALAFQVSSLPPGERLSEELTQQLIQLRTSSPEDKKFTEYITLALGRAGDPQLTLPIMSELALAPDTEPELRATAVTALGFMTEYSAGAKDAAAVLLQVARRFTSPDDWEIRWPALAGLTALREPQAAQLLRQALTAQRRELRWSAACWLAAHYDDASGQEVLQDLISWEFLDKQVGDRGVELQFESKEGYMIQALNALAALRGEEAREILEGLSTDSRSLKVRNAALRALGELSQDNSNSSLIHRASTVARK